LKAFDPWSKAILAWISSALTDRATADKTISITYAPWEKGDAKILNWCEKTECFFQQKLQKPGRIPNHAFFRFTMKCNIFKSRRLEIFPCLGKTLKNSGRAVKVAFRFGNIEEESGSLFWGSRERRAING